jgi:MoxR-like ATPase
VEDIISLQFKNLEASIADNRADPPYVYDADTLRAVKVAGVLERVLLVRGAPGTGKTTLARNLANALGWDYIESVITSRTQARDLLWSFDNVERLNDAYDTAIDRAPRVRDKRNYLVPGPLLRAFAPALALDLSKSSSSASPKPGAVVLIDEIDKADPDLPNDLLVPLEKKEFPVDVLPAPVRAQRPVFIVVTTNEERDLPQAFLRRCVIVTLQRPVERGALLNIAKKHFPKLDEKLFDAVREIYDKLGRDAEAENLRAPATAEFLDALSACEELDLKSNSDDFEFALRAAMWKHGHGTGT